MSLNACAPPPAVSERMRRLFLDLLPVIHGVIRQVCSRSRLTADDQAEFTSIVFLKLIENDYAVLRAFRGDSGVPTYLHAVVRRCLLDARIKEWGKWRPSRWARRLGPLATMLERLVTREGLPMQEVVPTLKHHPAFMVSSSDVWKLHEALPPRAPRHRQVDLTSNLDVSSPQRADAGVDLCHLEKQAQRVRAALATVVASLSPDDRRLLRLRFQKNLPVGRIAALTGASPAALYRRLPMLLETIRVKLMGYRLTASDVRPLIGNTVVNLEGLLSTSSAAGSRSWVAEGIDGASDDRAGG
jgi:RNA polymerase sigma factor (sigma-70 family)